MQLIKKVKRPNFRQRGFSIMEIMIGTALIASLLGSVMVLQARSNNETTGRNDADSLASFQQIVGQYMIANRTDIEAAMGGDATAAAAHCLVNVAADGTGGTVSANSTKHTCAFDATLLRAKGVWPNGMSVNVNGTGRWVAIVRQIWSGGATPAATGADEVLIVQAPIDGSGDVLTTGTVTFTGDVRRASEELSAGMAALGGSGGYVPPGKDYANCQYNATTKQVCGAGWVVTLSDFTD